MPMEVRWHTRFEDVSEAWDSLNARAGGNPVLESRFVATVLEHFAGRMATRVCVCALDGEPLAAAVIAPKGAFAVETFQVGQAPLGFWVGGGGGGFEPAAQAILQAQKPWVRLFGVLQLDPVRGFQAGATGRVAFVDYIRTARVVPRGGFDAYWNTRGKNLRRNMTKIRNRLSREGVTVALDVLTVPEAMADAVARFGVLEQSGWKGRAGTAVSADNAQGRFYADLLQRYAATGHAVVFQLRFDDRVVASDLCVADERTMVIMKTAYDETVAKYSPALLMHVYMLEREFGKAEDARRTIEFYGRSLQWHKSLTDDERVLHHANVYRTRLEASLHALLRRRAAQRMGNEVGDAAPAPAAERA